MQATLQHAFRMLLQHTSNAQQATVSALRAANDSRRSTMTQQMPSVCTCKLSRTCRLRAEDLINAHLLCVCLR